MGKWEPYDHKVSALYPGQRDYLESRIHDYVAEGVEVNLIIAKVVTDREQGGISVEFAMLVLAIVAEMYADYTVG